MKVVVTLAGMAELATTGFRLAHSLIAPWSQNTLGRLQAATRLYTSSKWLDGVACRHHVQGLSGCKAALVFLSDLTIVTFLIGETVREAGVVRLNFTRQAERLLLSKSPLLIYLGIVSLWLGWLLRHFVRKYSFCKGGWIIIWRLNDVDNMNAWTFSNIWRNSCMIRFHERQLRFWVPLISLHAIFLFEKWWSSMSNSFRGRVILIPFWRVELCIGNGRIHLLIFYWILFL